MAIVYATEPHLFITDPNVSPFNVGARLELEDFTKDQTADFNRRYGPPAPLQTESEIAGFYQLVGGHPFLIHQGLHEMHDKKIVWEEFESQASLDEGPYSEHLRRLLVMLKRDSELCEVVKGLLQDPPHPCPTIESFYRLRSSGVVSGKTQRDARLRCRLYAAYLKSHLL